MVNWKIRLAAILIVTAIRPAPIASAADEGEGKRLYQTYCSGCHGDSGKGDGPAAKGLPVKPADHTRSAMQQHSDEFLSGIIANGGPSVGKSPLMPAWSGVLKEPQIAAIVSYIRALSADRKGSAAPGRATK